MIRLMTERDKLPVLDYLYQEADYNIFFIGDIETFGFETDFQRGYLEIDAAGNFLSAFIRYRENAIYYSHKHHFNTDYLKIFRDDPFEYISGKSDLMDLIKPYLEGFKPKRMYFCKASKIKSETTEEPGLVKRMTTEKECEKLYDLLSEIEEFGIHKKSKSEFVESKMKSLQMGENYYIEENGRIVSSVATTAETTKNAMVVAVATAKEYRRKGYATKLLTALMKYYFNTKKKTLCLFYDNPEAGKIYLRLGFEYLGTWDMYVKIDN